MVDASITATDTPPEDPAHEVDGAAVVHEARAAVYERAVEIFPESGLLLVSRESKVCPPNFFLVRLPAKHVTWATTTTTTTTTTTASSAAAATDALSIPLTSFGHPQPTLLHVKKEHIQYTRCVRRWLIGHVGLSVRCQVEQFADFYWCRSSVRVSALMCVWNDWLYV